MTNKLFAGIPGTPGGPSLEDLYKQCPVEFRRLDSEWHRFATRFRLGGGANGTNWKTRSKDRGVITQQMLCFTAVSSATVMDKSSITCLMQDSVAAWMLSEMLTELPEYVPFGKRT
jgi:hypothetical protein